MFHLTERASLVAQPVKNPPAIWEARVGKIPWREGMATHSSVLTGRIPWTEELDRKQLSMHVFLLFKLASAFIL